MAIKRIHPDTRIDIHWTSVHGMKFNVQTTYEHFNQHLVEILETTLVDNVETVYYTINNETYQLDYYNYGAEDDN